MTLKTPHFISLLFALWLGVIASCTSYNAQHTQQKLATSASLAFAAPIETAAPLGKFYKHLRQPGRRTPHF